MRLGAISVSCLVLLSCNLFAQEPEILSLQDAIQIALKHNRTVQSARLDIEKSSHRLSAVKTRLFPSVSMNVLASRLLSPFSLSFEEGAFGTFPDIGPVPAENTKIETESSWTVIVMGTVQQPLSQLYQIKLNQALLKSVHEEAKEKEREEKQEIINQVKKLYYGILQSQSALRYSEEQIDSFRELKRVTDDYVVQKVALKSDGMEVKARLAKAEYDTLVTRNQMDAQKEQMNILLGRDIRTNFAVNPVAEPAAFETELEKAQTLALQQRPELMQAQWKLKEAELDARIKKSEYIPDVSLSLNYYSPLNVSFIPDHFVSFGFYMSWDPLDWGRKSHELAEKRKIAEQARLSLREIEQRVLAEVNSQHRKLRESRLLYETVRLYQEAAQEKFRVTTNRFKEQSALLKDVLQAETSLEETRDQLEQALLSMWVARADFEKAIGMEE